MTELELLRQEIRELKEMVQSLQLTQYPYRQPYLGQQYPSYNPYYNQPYCGPQYGNYCNTQTGGAK